MSFYVIACGGTGGHLSPGIALAQVLTERGHQCSLLVSAKKVDAELLSRYPDLDWVAIPGAGFGWAPMDFLRFFFLQLYSFWVVLRILVKKKADFIVGFGGFTTIAVSIAGFILGRPIILHEANHRAGRAIRLVSALARRVYLPPGVQLKSLPPRTMRHYGYPVRREIRPISKSVACKRLGVREDGRRLLVFGGSQGATAFNNWVLDNCERLTRQGIHIYCVTGLNKGGHGCLEYRSEEGDVVEAVFTPFVHNIAEVLCASDLVVSRAGAGSIAEFCRCALPCILIPYPHAADDHQTANARFLEKRGGGVLLPQSQMHKLYDEIMAMVFNDWILNKFKYNLKMIGVENSLDLIADDLERMSLEENRSLLSSLKGN